jgi:predicted permease
MTALLLFSAIARLFSSILLGWALTRVGHMLNKAERVGMGLMGGCGLMTTAVILDNNSEGTPFDVWAAVGFTLGLIFFFLGFVSRKLRHDKANDQQSEIAREHLRARGKL